MAEEERVEPTLDPNAAAPQAAVAAPAGGHDAEEEAPKPKGKGKLLIIIALVVLIAGGVGGYMYMQHSAEEKHRLEEEAKRPDRKSTRLNSSHT